MLEELVRNNKKTLYLIGLYFVLIVLISYFWPKQIDWRPSYSALHSKPYGAEVLRAELPNLFSNTKVWNSDRPIFNTAHDTIEFNQKSAYFFVNKNFLPDSLELSRLYSFAAKGNTVFIAAEDFAEQLLDSLKLGLNENYLYPNDNDSVLLNFVQKPFLEKDYPFPQLQFLRYFEKDSLFDGKSIAHFGETDNYNQVIVPYYKGNFILNSFPLAFTNYYVLNEESNSYVSNCLSYLGDFSNLIWDEYYKIGKPGHSKTPLKEILKIPGLRWAYWLGLFSILLFIAFHSKRRQRIIPIEEPVRNSSVEYVETMGNLYFDQSNYQNISHKKIEYFKSYLFRQYNMHNIEFSENDIVALLGKTDKTREELSEIFSLISRILKGGEVKLETLKALTKQINNFYK